MTRPRVVCHMMASIDGRIVPTGRPLGAAARRDGFRPTMVELTREVDGGA